MNSDVFLYGIAGVVLEGQAWRDRGGFQRDTVRLTSSRCSRAPANVDPASNAA